MYVPILSQLNYLQKDKYYLFYLQGDAIVIVIIIIECSKVHFCLELLEKGILLREEGVVTTGWTRTLLFEP